MVECIPWEGLKSVVLEKNERKKKKKREDIRVVFTAVDSLSLSCKVSYVGYPLDGTTKSLTPVARFRSTAGCVPTFANLKEKREQKKEGMLHQYLGCVDGLQSTRVRLHTVKPPHSGRRCDFPPPPSSNRFSTHAGTQSFLLRKRECEDTRAGA